MAMVTIAKLRKLMFSFTVFTCMTLTLCGRFQYCMA